MKLTILMYHKIDELNAKVRHPGNYVSPAQFDQQMDALRRVGLPDDQLRAVARLSRRSRDATSLTNR